MAAYEPITADMTIEHLLATYPELVPSFRARRMYCPHCELAKFMTIQDACRIYRENLNQLLEEFNQTPAGGA